MRYSLKPSSLATRFTAPRATYHRKAGNRLIFTGAHTYIPWESLKATIRALDFVAAGRAETSLDSLNGEFTFNRRAVILRLMVMSHLLEGMVQHSDRADLNAERQVWRSMQVELETLIQTTEGRVRPIGEALTCVQLAMVPFLDEFGLAFRQDELVSRNRSTNPLYSLYQITLLPLTSIL